VATDLPSILPPLRVAVVTSPAMSRSFADDTLTEAARIWRAAGLTIEWRSGVAAAPGEESSDVTVTFDEAPTPFTNGNATLGWITFSGPDAPIPDIHLSRGNAAELMTRTASMRAAALIALLTLPVVYAAGVKSDVDWPVNGGAGNARFSALAGITPANVRRLQVAWTYDSHDAFKGSEMQSNPIVVDGVLYATTP